MWNYLAASHYIQDHQEEIVQQAIEAFNQGVMYVQDNELKKALLAFDKAIEFDPHMALAYNARGAVHALSGSIDKGIADCDEAIRLAPQENQFYRTRGLIYSDIDEKAKSEADLAKAEELGFKK